MKLAGVLFFFTYSCVFRCLHVLALQVRTPRGLCDHSMVTIIDAQTKHHGLLVGGLEHFLFVHILGIVIPTD